MARCSAFAAPFSVRGAQSLYHKDDDRPEYNALFMLTFQDERLRRRAPFSRIAHQLSGGGAKRDAERRTPQTLQYA